MTRVDRRWLWMVDELSSEVDQSSSFNLRVLNLKPTNGSSKVISQNDGSQWINTICFMKINYRGPKAAITTII